MQRNARRPSHGSNVSLNSHRKSSINPRDLERIQAAVQATVQNRHRLSPRFIIFIIVLSPIFIFVYNCAVTHFDGSLIRLLSEYSKDPNLFSIILPAPFSQIAWKIILCVVSLQIVFIQVLPHDDLLITVSSGEKEWRHLSGFSSCLLTLLLYVMGVGMGFYRGDVLYVHWTEVLSVVNVLSFIIIAYLFARSHRFDISSADALSEIYFGSEVLPIIFGIDVKHFITYRMTLTFWPLYATSAMYYNYMAFGRLNEDLVACAVLQLVYVAKWQWFEHFYFNNLDAQIHRAGFYRIWGVLVFLPILYFTPLTLLAKSTVTHSISVRIFLFIVGLTSIYFTMDIDRQRYEFRHANGNMKIWGRDPFFISAKYRRENGDTAVNFLLGSGWWGMSRHLNYLSEWITFLSWTMLQNKSTFLSYLPLLFLAVVLIFRISRDEVRCLAKYGGTWVNYCNRVPYLLIPAVY